MIMLRYAVYRFFTMLLTLLVVSVLIFVIINLPPGDYLSNQIAELQASGQSAGVAKAEFLRNGIRAGPPHVGTIPDLDGLLARPARVFGSACRATTAGPSSLTAPSPKSSATPCG